jgi:peptide/nickel transport system permease protein
MSPAKTLQPIRLRSLWWRRAGAFWNSPANRVGLAVAIFIVLLALVPKELLPFDPTGINLGAAKQPGFWAGNIEHILGTDFLGRDMLSRSIYAARLTLIISVSAVTIAALLGLALGLIAGYFGGLADELISWLVDVQLAFPIIALALALIAVIGGNIYGLILVLAITSWAGMARVARGQTLAARNELYVEAAQSIGVPVHQILRRHLLPNVLSPLLAVITYQISLLVLTESALSFLGLGVAPPQVTWGGMIGDGRNYIYDAWWTAAVPGIMIAILVFAFNFLGDGLRDAFDPTALTTKA